jgi:aldehyde:ferredoxin oxidoreductase
MTENGYGSFLCQAIAETLSTVTGRASPADQWREVSERIYTLLKLLNLREGVGCEAGTLPKRLLTVPIPEGPKKGSAIPAEALDRMLNEFHAIRGWDQSAGVPTREMLTTLHLVSSTATGG